jgi:hypothetical protein
MGYDREDDSGVVRVFAPKSPSLVSTLTETARNPDDAKMFEHVKSMLEIVHTVAAIEALALGGSLGLSARELDSIISNAAGASEAFRAVAPLVVAGDFKSGPTIAETREKLVSRHSNRLGLGTADIYGIGRNHPSSQTPPLPPPPRRNSPSPLRPRSRPRPRRYRNRRALETMDATTFILTKEQKRRMGTDKIPSPPHILHTRIPSSRLTQHNGPPREHSNQAP